MKDIIDPATGLPLRFPNPVEEAYTRAQEFAAFCLRNAGSRSRN